MYGIKRSDGMHLSKTRRGEFFLRDPYWIVNPVIFESAREVDQYMQDLMTKIGDYSISVYKLTKEQEEDIIMRKLRGA